MVEDEQVVCEVPLYLHGIMSNLPIEELISEEKKLLIELRDRGYSFSDPIIQFAIFFCNTFTIYSNYTTGNVRCNE